MNASDYAPFARGQRVLVQLKGLMCLATSDEDGIALAQAPAEPLGRWMAALSESFSHQKGRAATEAELAKLLEENPPPMKPLMYPVIIGVLEQQGELLIATYETDPDPHGHPRKVRVTLDPNDIKHVSELRSALISA